MKTEYSDFDLTKSRYNGRKVCGIKKCKNIGWLSIPIEFEEFKADMTVCAVHYEHYIENNEVVDKLVDNELKKTPKNSKYYFISYVYETMDNGDNNLWEYKPESKSYENHVLVNEHPFTFIRKRNMYHYTGYTCYQETDCYHNPYHLISWKEISEDDYKIYLRERCLRFW